MATEFNQCRGQQPNFIATQVWQSKGFQSPQCLSPSPSPRNGNQNPFDCHLV